MKKAKKILSAFLAATILIVPTATSYASSEVPEEVRGDIASRYIRAIIDKAAEDYRFGADKEAMYEAVLDYVMRENPDLLEGSITAAIDTLDKYSDYFTKEEISQFINAAENAYVGIGVTVVSVEAGALVQEVVDGGGAKDAGLLPGDIICAVDGTDVSGMSLDEIVSYITGEEGSTVNISFLRGEEVLSAVIERKLIQAETVYYTVDDGVGYIYISEFSSNTPDAVNAALKDIEKQSIRKYIIDVRDNPGGNLASVIETLSLFVPRGKTLTKLEYNDESYNETLKSTANFSSKPNRKIAVLVNENSASAAELFSGALQTLKYATVVGRQTVGKGCMQEFMLLINPPGFSLGDIKLTTAEFTRPDGSKIQGIGIEPDVDVKNAIVPYDASHLTPMTISDRYAVGSQAEDVRAIEERLNVLGYYTGEIDDTFDENTAAATRMFQKDTGLYVYGVMDYTTQNVLNDEIAKAEMEEDRQYNAAFELLKKE